MGGTDYKYGLNLGRGLYEADQIVKLLVSNTNNDIINIDNTLSLYKKYWLDILDKEFGDPKRKLTDDKSIFYKYVVNGRTVNGKCLGEDARDLQFYIDAFIGHKDRNLK